MKSVGPSNRLKNDVREDLHMFVVTGWVEQNPSLEASSCSAT
jgi:hypothetical protein